MGNMGYCRFTNTLEDLRDCYNHWEDNPDMSEDEEKARERLLKLCQRIVGEYGDCEDED